MKSIARGILYHHFWGEYSAEVYLDFGLTWQAEEAQRQLRAKTGLDWMQQNVSVGVHVSNEQLTKLEAFLAEHGADKSKISSLATSIDHGESFFCTFELEHPAQTTFNFV